MTKTMSWSWLIAMLLVSVVGRSCCVEVHFEAADSGFFLKHSRQPPVAPEISNIQSVPAVTSTKTRAPYDSVLSVDRFTVVQTTQPVSIRASYGPFSTKQTVPARYIVPDAAMDNQGDYLNNTTAALIELQQSNMHLDISAHLVRPTIPQDSPVLRVLFHAGADPGGHLQRQKICVLLHVAMGSQIPLKGRCMPDGEDGVCVAEVVIPSNWWPPIPPPYKDGHTATPTKVPQRMAQVSYSVFEPPLRNPEQCEPKVQIQPLTTFAQVPLVAPTTAFKELRADESITILMPQHTLYPMSKIHVPVFLHQSPDQRIAAFTMRARVKAGIKLLGATSSTDAWNISIEKENLKHTTARVTAFRNEQDSASVERKNDSETRDDVEDIIEVFSWLLEVSNDSKDVLDGGKIVWSVTYVYENTKMKDSSTENIATTDETKKRLIGKLEINKDDIQAVLPMAKNWELMNTAILTGRQVAQAMKVFIVSQAGKVADVTLQSSCHAEDESVIKVSSSCSSVYVDGSEIRGSSNASVVVKYGTYVGVAKFIVWMPEFPLEVYISDFRLSQIKGWKVMDDTHYMHNKQSRRRRKRSYVWQQQNPGFYNNLALDKFTCRARYQQSPVEVYARFLANDQNSGRMSYFISRRTALRVTDLVQPLLRVADPKIASLKGRILQGKAMGRTDVQVLSPITGRVIGAKEIRVGSDKVSLSKLIVRVVSGLQLTILPDNTIENGYLAETSVTHKLTAQYQEGLLDIDLEFSDGSRTPLRDISVQDYFLLVESLDTEVVAFAPMLASHHPRVIAVGEGNGNLLRITLLLSEDCRTRRNLLATSAANKQVKQNITPLASALASVEVDFNNNNNNNENSGSKHEAVQNDGFDGRERKNFRSNGDLADIIVGIPLKDASNHHEPAVQARQHRGSSGLHSLNKLQYANRKSVHSDMTSMEVGMYVLLTAFCFAIIVFVISCVVYASKFRPITIESGLDRLEQAKTGLSANGLLREPRMPKEPTTNAHDWVWLGRSTMDRTSLVNDADGCTNATDSRIRITSNPIVNYANCSRQAKTITSFNVNGPKPGSVHVPPPRRTTDVLEKPTDYRPPVPPHRNIGVRAVVNTCNPTTHTELGKVGQRYDCQKHRTNKPLMPLPAQDASPPVELAMPDLSMTFFSAPGHGGQQQAQQPLQPQQLSPAIVQRQNILNTQGTTSPDHIFSPHELNVRGSCESEDNNSKQQSQPQPQPQPQPLHNNKHKKRNEELHNAEKLVENDGNHLKSAFQFDTLTPRKAPSQTAVALPKRILSEQRTLNVNTNGSSSDDSGGFVTHAANRAQQRRSRVKRATVVGNPMFSSQVDDNDVSAPGESLGLDDLDMNYEQIMHYFDNLKESNA